MKNKRYWLVCYIFVLIVCETAFASDSWYSRHAEGWFWYKDDVQQSNEDELREQGESSKSSTPYTDLLEKTASNNKEIFSRLALEPNEQNLLAYMKMMDGVSAKIDTMRALQKSVFLKHPEYDPHVKYPTSQDGIRINYQIEKERIETKVKGLVGNYGLVLFIADGCKHCEIFEPVAKQFVDKYGFSILPVVIGNKTDGLFNYVRDNGISAYMKVTYYPSLYLLHYATQNFHPIAHGAVSLEEIERNAVAIVN